MVDARVTTRVDLDALQRTLQARIQAAIQRVSFALLAGRQADLIGQPDLPDTQFQFKLGTPPNIQDAKTEHENWILGNGLRDCAEALNTFLDKSQEICVLWSFGSRARILAADWKRLVVKDGKQFHMHGLAAKLDWLRREYGLEIDADTANDLLTINKARNCLVHRHGVVQQQDKNGDAGLTVRWTKPELQVEGEKGLRPIRLGEVGEPGGRLMLAQKRTSKNFSIGDRVQFDSEEFSELCWTFITFGIQFVASVADFGKSKGIRFNSPAADGESA